MTAGLAALLVLAQSSQAPPQPTASAPAGQRVEIAGQLLILADALPRRDVTELRPQAAIEVTARPSAALRLKLDGFVEGLVADRSGRVSEAIARVREAWVEVTGSKGDVRAGYGRLVWGRLDEVQPSDVINPVDTSRFLFDGRSAARLPVTFVRGRVFASERLTLEGIVVPLSSSGTFDELDEDSSPFNLRRDLAVVAGSAAHSPPYRDEPAPGWGELSGGGRMLATIGRVDVGAGAYRGFEGVRVVDVEPSPVSLVGRFPRFTMLSADFETVTGDWAWRGEAAFFVDKTLQRVSGPALVKGRALDAGVGFDRRTGEYRVFASAIFHREWSAEDPAARRTDVNLVGSIERQLGRDRYLVRAFAVVNPADASGFIRGLVVWRAADNMAIEGSAAAFVGDGDDTLARFKTRDFLMTRVRWRF